MFTFDKRTFEKANPIDMLNFARFIFEMEGEYSSLFLNNYSYENSKEIKTMCTVTITFQAWKDGETGEGQKFTWVCYRAKDFSCSNTQFNRIKP